MRRILFQLHLWTGLITGLYVVAIFGSGAALVYRIDLQRALDPHLFTPRAPGPLAEPAIVMEAVSRAYPQHRLAGVDAPTTARATYLAYVVAGDQFVTVLIDPASAAILGELPQRSIVRILQGVHANLLAGQRGRTVHAIGACSVLVLCFSGLTIWWRGASLRPRSIRQLHRTIGIAMVLPIALWSITGLYFLFPAYVRGAVNAISPVTARRPPLSGAPNTSDHEIEPSWRAAIEQARRHATGGYVARVVLPSSPRAAILVMFAASSPTPTGPNVLAPIYLDRFTLERLPEEHAGPQTAGDRVMTWLTPLHVGSIAGEPGRALWLLLAGAPLILFGTGMWMWWSRVIRPRL